MKVGSGTDIDEIDNLRAASSGSSWVHNPAFWLVTFCLLSACALSVDLNIARFVQSTSVGAIPRDIRKLISLSEIFSHAIGAGLILICVLVLTRSKLTSLLPMACCAYGAALLADLAKLIVGRVRPHHLAADVSIWESFIGWFPILRGTPGYPSYDSNLQSFPSGHTATAVGLAIGLSTKYPQGKWFFYAMAFLASLQRIESNAHFLSDCLAGAAIGCFAGAVVLGNGVIGRFLRDLEHKPTGQKLAIQIQLSITNPCLPASESTS